MVGLPSNSKLQGSRVDRSTARMEIVSNFLLKSLYYHCVLYVLSPCISFVCEPIIQFPFHGIAFVQLQLFPVSVLPKNVVAPVQDQQMSDCPIVLLGGLLVNGTRAFIFL